MLSDQLLSELHKLNPAEKLRVVQLLVNELADDQTLPSNESDIIWSLHTSAAAAQQLQSILDDHKHNERG